MEIKENYLSKLSGDTDIQFLFERPYLVRAISTNPDVKKTHACTILACLNSLNFEGNFEVMQNFDIIIRCTYSIVSRLEKAFKGQIEFLPVEFLDNSVKH